MDSIIQLSEIHNPRNSILSLFFPVMKLKAAVEAQSNSRTMSENKKNSRKGIQIRPSQGLFKIEAQRICFCRWLFVVAIFVVDLSANRKNIKKKRLFV